MYQSPTSIYQSLLNYNFKIKIDVMRTIEFISNKYIIPMEIAHFFLILDFCCTCIACN